MIGLLVLGTLALWLTASIWIARRLARAIPMKANARPWASVGFFGVIFLLPVADELAARPYFAALCRKDAVLRINAEKIKGKRVVVSVAPSNEVLARIPIRVVHSRVSYREFGTDELLAEYDIYRGSGGLLAQFLSLTGTPPLTGSFYCAPERDPPLARKYGFIVVD